MIAYPSDNVNVLVLSENGKVGYDRKGNLINEIPDAEVFVSDDKKALLYTGYNTTQVWVTGFDRGTADVWLSLSHPNSEVHTLLWDDVELNSLSYGYISTILNPLPNDGDGAIYDYRYRLVMDEDGDGIYELIIEPSQEIRTRVTTAAGLYLPILLR